MPIAFFIPHKYILIINEKGLRIPPCDHLLSEAPFPPPPSIPHTQPIPVSVYCVGQNNENADNSKLLLHEKRTV